MKNYYTTRWLASLTTFSLLFYWSLFAFTQVPGQSSLSAYHVPNDLLKVAAKMQKDVPVIPDPYLRMMLNASVSTSPTEKQGESFYVLEKENYFNWEETANVWQNTYQYNYVYNTAGQNAEYVSSLFDHTSNNWVKEYRYLYYYNPDRFYDVDEEIDQRWDNTGNTWVNEYRYENNTELAPHTFQYLTQKWSITVNKWENQRRSVHQYDQLTGDLSEVLTQDWDREANEWDNFRKTLYGYTAQGYQKSYTVQNWNTATSSFVNDYRYVYARSIEGTLQNYEYEVWDDPSGLWVKNNKFIYKYDKQNRFTGYTYQNWDAGANDYENYFQYYYSYVSSNTYLYDYILHQLWDAAADTWQNNYYYDYSYDSNNRVNEYMAKEWDDVSSTWSEDRRTLYSWNSNDNILGSESQEWEENTRVWKNTQRYAATYREVTLDVPNSVSTLVDVNVFPNPCNTSSVMEYKLPVESDVLVSVADVTGREVLMLTMPGQPAGVHQVTIDVSGFASGLYSYRMSIGGQLLSGKLVVE